MSAIREVVDLLIRAGFPEAEVVRMPISDVVELLTLDIALTRSQWDEP